MKQTVMFACGTTTHSANELELKELQFDCLFVN